jgi:hypothetical protein
LITGLFSYSQDNKPRPCFVFTPLESRLGLPDVIVMKYSKREFGSFFFVSMFNTDGSFYGMKDGMQLTFVTSEQQYIQFTYDSNLISYIDSSYVFELSFSHKIIMKSMVNAGGIIDGIILMEPYPSSVSCAYTYQMLCEDL